MKKLFIFACVIVLPYFYSSISQSEVYCGGTYKGIEFPNGSKSFADEVVLYLPSSSVSFPYNDPNGALGVPDAPDPHGTSLGNEGILIVKFTDNFLTTSGDGVPDLWIFEGGEELEGTAVEISSDGVDWISVGSTAGGIAGIDIDAYIGSGVLLDQEYYYVKIIDLLPSQSTGIYEGADIDAIGAKSSAPNSCSTAPWIDEVVFFDQPVGSSDEGGLPTDALNAADATGTTGFVSIDIPETLILAFTDNSAIDELGNDIRIYEHINGDSRVDVYASMDNINYVYLGRPNGTIEYDIADYPDLDYINFIKFVGVDNGGSSAGFDLDAVVALNFSANIPVTVDPSIAQTPMFGPPGTIFTQWGTGFTPNSTVTLQFRNHLGEELPSSQVTTDPAGGFNLVYNSDPEKPEGTHTWWAVDDASGEISKTIAYEIIVKAGQTTPIDVGQTQAVPQTNREETFGKLIPRTEDLSFRSDMDTFVIVHGWNNDGATTIPNWMKDMGYTIAVDDDSPAKGSNVFYWDWLDQAKSPNPDDPDIMKIIPWGKVPKSGENLAKQLNEVISPYPNYEGNIHLIGFSLGSGVIVFAAKYIFENSNESQFTFKDKITHLTLLDSAFPFDRPGGSFLRKNKDDIFVDNYFSLAGKLTGYWEADTNVYLINSPAGNLPEKHGYAHKWYHSSITNFSDPNILGDGDIPTTTMPYGFYWWDKKNQDNVVSGYIQELRWPQWLLRPFLGYITSGIIVDTAYYTGEIASDTWEKLNEFAERSGKKINLVSVNTFNSVSDTADYVKDELSHAFQEALSCSGIICGALRLENHSDSLVTVMVQIPDVANGMTFGYDFKYASPGTVIEAFMNDQLLFSTFSHDVVGKGYQMTPWIDISQFAGEQKSLSFRISNPEAATEGAVRIDDLIFARIENQLYGDHDEDCDVDGADLATFIFNYSDEGLDNFTFSFGKGCL